MNFEEWYLDNREDAARDVLLDTFEAGAQSQQAKIDLLEKELTETQAFLNKQNHIKQSKIDELQARVNEIASHLDINFDEDRDDDQHSYWSGYNQAMRELNDILKGNKDEN